MTDLTNDFVANHEFIRAARETLNDQMWDYLVGGTETETTLARNRAALDAVALRPRVLVDVSEIDATWEFLGKTLRLPVMLAPVGGLDSFDPLGAVSVARGAGEFGAGMMFSSVTERTKPEVRAAMDGPLVYQLYVRGFGRFIEDEVEAAIEAGFDAFAFTVDTAVYSRRERDIVKRFAKPWRRFVNDESVRAQAALNWKDIERIRKAYDIPLMIKGVGTAEDARIAVDHGLDWVYVSNHGGRQLDHGMGSADVLTEVVDAVKGQIKILMDGSVSRGTDVVKAVALGADMVGIGRLYCYALAVAGPAGIVRMLEILENEIHSALGLAGVASFRDLTPGHLRRGAPLVGVPGVHSAFPLLDG
ncbi:MAG: alpha-hydroxy acid oxidase [Pseudomonadota bacterium]